MCGEGEIHEIGTWVQKGVKVEQLLPVMRLPIPLPDTPRPGNTSFFSRDHQICPRLGLLIDIVSSSLNSVKGSMLREACSLLCIHVLYIRPSLVLRRYKACEVRRHGSNIVIAGGRKTRSCYAVVFDDLAFMSSGRWYHVGGKHRLIRPAVGLALALNEPHRLLLSSLAVLQDAAFSRLSTDVGR